MPVVGERNTIFLKLGKITFFALVIVSEGLKKTGEEIIPENVISQNMGPNKTFSARSEFVHILRVACKP